MQSRNIRLANSQPLTFQCIMCSQLFRASGKSLKQVADEVRGHVAQNHPEVSKSEAFPKAA